MSGIENGYEYTNLKEIVPIGNVFANLILLCTSIIYAVCIGFLLVPKRRLPNETGITEEELELEGDGTIPSQDEIIERLRQTVYVPPDEGVSFF